MEIMDGESLTAEASSAGETPASAGDVHARLRRDIVTGRLRAGAVLSQVGLAESYGVSRTPLREALRLLERDGLIEAERHRRVRVAPFSLDDLEQLYAMRISLECLAVRLTVQDLLSTDIEAMAADMTSMRAAAASFDYDAWSPPHIRLHRTVTQGAGARLRRTLDQLSEAAERYRFSYTTQVPLAWEQGLIEHQALVDRCAEGDPSGAAEALATHYGRVAVAAVGLLAPEREPTQIRAALRTELGLA